jgi:hypothetical protein
MATGMKSTPNCVCGKNDWQDYGGYFSPGLQQRGMLCSACGGISTFVCNGRENIFFIPNEKSDQIPRTAIDWLNEVVLPTWRARGEEIEKAQKPLEEICWKSACEKLGLPVGTKDEDVPEDKRGEWKKIWEEFYARPNYRIPEGFERPPIPAQMPEGITCYIQISDSIWQWVSREETLALIQPPDPVRVKHDNFFKQIFTELASILGIDNIDRKEIPNEYCGAENEPWYCFNFGSNTIKIGPRKRVYAIKIQASNDFDTRELRTVTVEEYGNTYSDRGEAGTPTELEVHAWNKEQLMRLLTIVAKSCFVT